MTPLIARAEVARRLGIAPRTVTDLVRRRELAAVRVGRLLRFTEAAVDAFIARSTVAAAEVVATPPVLPPQDDDVLQALPVIRRRRFM